MFQHVQPLLAFGLGGQEIVLLLALGVLLFGRNLPTLGRTIGKTITEVRRGIKGDEDDVEGPAQNKAPVACEPIRPPQRITTPAPRFEEPAPPPMV